MEEDKIISKQEELIEKLSEIIVHVGLPGEYKPKYNIIKELSKIDCIRCKKFVNELNKLRSELSELKKEVPEEKEKNIVTIEERTIAILNDDTFTGHPSNEETYQQRNAIKFLAKQIDILHKMRVKANLKNQ
jgi:phosphoenolpyruvate-protein kinase (PTS system EI component)